MPVKSTREPRRHAALAGTLTKEQLLSAINQDATESSLEKLLGPPNYRKSTSWSSFSVWTDKLNTGGDSPAMVTAEIAKYNGTPLVVSIYDPASGSSTLLPWHDKVARAYNDALGAATYEAALATQIAANNAAVAEHNGTYQQPSRDTNPVSTTARRSSPPLVLHYAGDPRPGAYDGDQRVATGTAHSTMIGTGRTEAEARANLESKLGYTGYSNIRIKEESFHKGQYEYTCSVNFDHETR